MSHRRFPKALLAALTIVANVAPVAAQRPVGIDPNPRVSLGVIEGDTLFEFDGVVTPFILPNGNLVIPVRGSSTIRVFSPTGAFVRSYGRAGAGPGEFRGLSSAWSRGDTIEAADYRLNRVTRFLPNGNVEVVTLQTTQRDLSAGFGPFGTGWAAAGVALGDTGRRDSVVVRRFDRAGNDLGALGFVLGMSRFRTPAITGPGPLSPRSVHAVRNNQVYIGETLTPRLSVFSAPGGARRELAFQPSAPPSVRQALNTVIDAAVARASAANAVAVRQRIEGFPVPERVPVFGEMLVDEANYVWVKAYDPLVHSLAMGMPASAGGRWLIIAPDGRQVGTIDVPANLQPVYITSNAVMGIARDEFGVESVRVHGLRRGQ